jgi:hypothetical protein
MGLTTVIIRWSGPHRLDDVAGSDACNGLYILVGRLRYERRDQVQYCGITEGRFCDRLTGRHHALAQIRSGTLTMWLGEIIYPVRFRRRHLELAEHCFAHFFKPGLNTQKVVTPPKPVCFISQWADISG